MKTVKLILLKCLILCSSWAMGQATISLITPYDRDTIETFYPLFAWQYFDIAENRDLEDYVYTLVEINSDQSATSAVQVNNPIIRIEGIQGYQFPYPFDAPKLKINQRYGWRIDRRINGIITHNSEAWEFIIYKEVIVPKKYVVLGIQESSDIITLSNEGFYFKVKSRYEASNLSVKLIDDKGIETSFTMGKDQKKSTEFELVETAPNCFYLKTSNLKSGVYKVIAVDPRKNKFSAKFKVL